MFINLKFPKRCWGSFITISIKKVAKGKMIAAMKLLWKSFSKNTFCKKEQWCGASWHIDTRSTDVYPAPSHQIEPIVHI